MRPTLVVGQRARLGTGSWIINVLNVEGGNIQFSVYGCCGLDNETVMVRGKVGAGLRNEYMGTDDSADGIHGRR